MASRRTGKSERATRVTSPISEKPAARSRSGWSLSAQIDAHPLLFFALAGILLLLVVYRRAPQAPFVYDDLDQVVNNQALLSWHAFTNRFLQHPVALTASFRGVGGLTYRPVFWLSLAADRYVWSLNAAGFHFTNLALHFANGFLLLLVLRKLGLPARIAVAVSLLWLALPMNVEVVAWVSARSYGLATLFVLLSLWCALRSLEESRTGARRWILLLYGVSCVLAPLANEIGFLIFPLTALLLIQRAIPWKRATPLLGLALLAAVAGLLLRTALRVQQSFAGASYRLAGAEFWKYLGWIVAPVHMSVERSTSVPTHLPGAAAALAWAGLIALPAAAIALRRRFPLPALGVLWVTLCLLPFCGFIFVYQGMAERFTYLASIGVAMAAVGAVAASPRPARRGVVSLLMLWVVWGLWRGAERMNDWTDPVTLYQHSLDATPESPALWFNLGYTLKEAGDLPQAEHAFLRVLALRPTYPKLNASLGDVYMGEGRLGDAQRMYAAALASDPEAYQTLLNSAVAFQRAGEIAEAEAQDRRAIAAAPAESAAYTNLGALYLANNRVNDAAGMFARAIQARPTDPSPYFDLAVLYQGAGRLDQARPLYEKVLALKPGDADTLANLAAMR